MKPSFRMITILNLTAVLLTLVPAHGADKSTKTSPQKSAREIVNADSAKMPMSHNEIFQSLQLDPKYKIDFKNETKFNYTKKTGGVDGSGGGSVLHCQDIKGKKYYQLYDYEEASRPKRNLKIDLGPESLSVAEKIQLVLSRLAKINETRAKSYSILVNSFYENIERHENFKFGKTPDVKNEIIPDNCERVQAVIQIDPTLPEDKRFNINAKVWDELDNETKAGLILHEIIYYEQGLKDARMVRYFNSWISSKNLETLNQKQYLDLLSFAMLFTFDVYKGVKCNTYSAKLFEDGKVDFVKSCHTVDTDIISLPGLKARSKAYSSSFDPFDWANYGFQVNGWMFDKTVSSISAKELVAQANHGGRLLLLEDKIKVGEDIEFQVKKYGKDSENEQYRISNKVSYVGIETFSGKWNEKKDLPYIFGLHFGNEWIVKTNSSEVNLNSLKCPGANNYRDYLVTKYN